MDIYQIWTTYNKQWSRYEILAFMGVLILVCTAMAVCVHRKKLNIIQATAVIALVVFLGIVFGSTVFTRIGTVRQYELVPFWSWRDIIRYHDWTLLKENLLNCILCPASYNCKSQDKVVSGFGNRNIGISNNRV